MFTDLEFMDKSFQDLNLQSSSQTSQYDQQ